MAIRNSGGNNLNNDVRAFPRFWNSGCIAPFPIVSRSPYVTMDIEELYHYCRSLKGVSEGTPFGDDVLVFKVMGKIFALVSLTGLPVRVNLKCDPERAVELRARWASVIPGYHMNKKHWNTVVLDGELDAADVVAMIDHSYALVAGSLKKSEREALAQL